MAGAGAGPGRVAEGAGRVERPAVERAAGLGVGRVVVGRVVAVGRRRRGRGRVHDRDLDGLLGHGVVEGRGFGGVHGALHGGGEGVGRGRGRGRGRVGGVDWRGVSVPGCRAVGLSGCRAAGGRRVGGQ